QAERHGLDATGGDSPAHLVPQQRADLITDEAIQNSARLLSIDNVLIDAAGILDRGFDGLGSDLIKHDAENFGLAATQQLFQVLANRFAFAIRVSSEQN